MEDIEDLTKYFTRKTLFGRLQSTQIWMRQSGEFPRVEATFRVLKGMPILIRIESTNGDYTSRNQTKEDEYKKVEEGIILLLKREPRAKK